MPWGAPPYAVPDQQATIYLGDAGNTLTRAAAAFTVHDVGVTLTTLLDSPQLSGILTLDKNQRLIGTAIAQPFSVGPTFRKGNRKIP